MRSESGMRPDSHQSPVISPPRGFQDSHPEHGPTFSVRKAERPQSKSGILVCHRSTKDISKGSLSIVNQSMKSVQDSHIRTGKPSIMAVTPETPPNSYLGRQ